jgi:hypothetical protein
MPFRDLPVPAQLAMAHYMAIDGEAWQLPEGTESWSVSKLKKELPRLLPYFRRAYGDKHFGYVTIPMEALKESILQDDIFHQHGIDSFEAYDKWLHGQPGFWSAKHPTTRRWPVILSSYNDETLQGFPETEKFFTISTSCRAGERSRADMGKVKDGMRMSRKGRRVSCPNFASGFTLMTQSRR